MENGRNKEKIRIKQERRTDRKKTKEMNNRKIDREKMKPSLPNK